MPRIPRDTLPDSTLALIRDPYGFISTRCRRYRARLFETRLALQKMICLTGPEAAELFNDPSRFARRGAAPAWLEKTLFGQGGVQGLDGEAHRHRKQLFLSLTTAERVSQLSALLAGRWRDHAVRWVSRDSVVLYDELREILTRTVCAWSGVPLPEAQVERRTRELTALFQDAASPGPTHWRSRRARTSAEQWIADVISEIHAGRLQPAEDSAAHVIAWHRDPNGELLSPRVAAVELLNALRPTVAVAVYITFVAHALHEHPAWRRRLEAGHAGDADMFVQEVRRIYSFFPFLTALARDDSEWNGYQFPRGRRVLLDLYGTNHDSQAWKEPEKFRPERFESGQPNPFTFIPQGGGDPAITHRCPGEPITLALMKVAVDFLVHRIDYSVPAQDLRIDRSRLPALPRNRFVISDVTPRT